MLSKTYFAIDDRFNPLKFIDRYFNPYNQHVELEINQRKLKISWTKRADKALVGRTQVLFVELQLYFTCVVKKRVLFHEEKIPDAIKVNDKLAVIFRAVEAESCDPVAFAKNYPEKQQLLNDRTLKMSPKTLLLDFKNAKWHAEYTL